MSGVERNEGNVIMTMKTVVTTPGRTRYLQLGLENDKVILDELCEHTGFRWEQLPDVDAKRRVREETHCEAWGADHFNASDMLTEYLYYTTADMVVLDYDAIMASPIRPEYAEYEHCHAGDFVAPHQ